jgi:hypothetical protein
MATVRLEIQEGMLAPFSPATKIEVRRQSTAAALTVAVAAALSQTHLGFAELIRAARKLGYVDGVSLAGPESMQAQSTPPPKPDLPRS